MPRRHLLFALTAFLLAGGAFASPATQATDYLLFTTEASGTRCQIYNMDEQGNLTPREEHEVGGDSGNITVSPDGRVVVVSTCVSPMLSIFFIGKDGLADPPLYIMDTPFYPDYYPSFDPVAFHPSLPLFYTGFEPISSYQYSLTKRQVEPTSKTIMLGSTYPSYHLGFSKWSGTLVSLITTEDVKSRVQTVQIKEDGSFNQINPPLILPTLINSDFVVSPDGRWAAAFTLGNPELQFIRINQDGSAELTDSMNFDYTDVNNYCSLAFSPDSRRLLLLGYNGSSSLILFDIDPASGKLSRRTSATYQETGNIGSACWGLTISADGRYAAFRSVHPTLIGYNQIHVFRIHEDGTLEYLSKGHALDVDHYLGPLALVALPPKNAAKDWGMYE